MIRSMTGFGYCEYSEDNIRCTVEIKTVNHRYIDIFIRMPKQVSSLEDRVRSIISAKIQRGKVDVYITFEDNSEDAVEVVADERLAAAYSNALRNMARNLGIEDDVSASTLARFPYILKVENRQDEERVGAVLEKAVENAVAALVDMREKEGRN